MWKNSVFLFFCTVTIWQYFCMEKASIVTIFAVGKIFIPMKIFPMAVSNSIVQKSFANGTFRETVDGDDSPTPFYRCCPQQRKKCFYYSPLFRHQINRSRDKENWATLRTVLKKRFYLSNTRRERTTADEEVEDENMQMNVSGELATVWRRTDDDSSESTTPSLSRKKRKAAWWTTNSNVGAAPTKISRKCFEHDPAPNRMDSRGGTLVDQRPTIRDYLGDPQRPGGLQSTTQAGFNFLTTFTEQISKSMGNALTYEQLLNHTQQIFKQRYEDVLLDAVRDTQHTDHEKLLNILRQSWNHSITTVVKSCAQKMTFWSVCSLSACSNVIPSGIFASIFAAKLALCRRAGQSTVVPDAHSPSMSSDENSGPTGSSRSDGNVFRHKVVFCDKKSIFCLRCGPTTATVFCKTCQEKEDSKDGANNETNAHTWCLNPDCLADYENNGEIVCLTMAYCTLCKLPIQKDNTLELREGVCSCLIEDFTAEFFERDLSIPDD